MRAQLTVDRQKAAPDNQRGSYRSTSMPEGRAEIIPRLAAEMISPTEKERVGESLYNWY